LFDCKGTHFAINWQILCWKNYRSWCG